MIRKSSCSHAFNKLSFFYQKRAIAAIHSFKVTVFLQDRNCSKETSPILIMIPPWFYPCIYWKKSVKWRHHFLPSIFSVIVSFFHGSAWSDPYVEDTESSSCSHPFFQGLHGADNFWQQLLIKTSYFLGRC